jgi:hypothetical protein
VREKSTSSELNVLKERCSIRTEDGNIAFFLPTYGGLSVSFGGLSGLGAEIPSIIFGELKGHSLHRALKLEHEGLALSQSLAKLGEFTLGFFQLGSEIFFEFLGVHSFPRRMLLYHIDS